MVWRDFCFVLLNTIRTISFSFKECITKENTMNIKMLKTALVGLVLSVSGFANAGLINLVTNGDFETGDFTSWSVQNLANGGCGANSWVVNSTGTQGCSGNGVSLTSPISGTFAAFNTNDGPAGQLILSQQLTFGSNILSASLSWLDQQDSHAERIFSIDLFDAGNTTLLGNLFTNSASLSPDLWVSHTEALDSTLIQSLAGTTVTLRLTNNIPVSFTGPSGFGLDAVSFNVTTTDVPEPSTLAIFALGIMGLASRRFKKQS